MAQAREALTKRGHFKKADAEKDDQVFGRDALVKRLLTDAEELQCPITHSLMDDPVVAEDGNTYEREAIERALSVHTRSPLTNLPMSLFKGSMGLHLA